MITYQQYFIELDRHRKLADADYMAMDVNDFERKWLRSKTSPIIAALESAPLIDALPGSRNVFLNHLVEYVQGSVRIHRLMLGFYRESKN
jgi:hypothetical protein